MRSITTEIIQSHTDAAVSYRADGRWRLTTKSGHEVYLEHNGLYFHDCFGPFLSGEPTNEPLLSEMCALSNALWGCISLRETDPYVRRRVKTFAKRHHFKIDTGLFRRFGLCDALECFGNCTIELRLRKGCWWIGLPNGDGALIGDSSEGLTIDQVEGDCYAPALTMLNNLQGYAIVSGSPSFCTTCVVHGEMLGIKVIPEVQPSLLKICMTANAGQWLLLIVLQMFSGDFSAFGGPFFVSCFAPVLLLPFVPWKKMARRRGRALLNRFPQPPGCREASVEDARSRGMV